MTSPAVAGLEGRGSGRDEEAESRKSVEAEMALRLRGIAGILLGATPPPPAGDAPARDAGVVLDLLVRAVHADPAPDRLWLLYSAACGAYPTPEDVVAGTRFFGLARPAEATFWLLDRALEAETRLADGREVGGLVVVSDRVVVDVDHSARHELHTGIQQVVRRTLPLWVRDHPVLPVAWTDDWAAWRPLTASETQRVLSRDHPPAGPAPQPTPPTPMIVPWRTVVVLPETPLLGSCDRLAALAQYSANPVVVIGHDCVPVVSADLVPPKNPNASPAT